MALEVRPVRDEELPEFILTMNGAFLERPDAEKVIAAVRPIWDLERTWAAFDDGKMCGTFRSWATELTVPGGGRVRGAAVSGVTVLPTHRRRGILRAMVEAEHTAIRERGEAAGLLYASEYPIYGRFGYGPSTRGATWTLDTRGTGFHGASTGGVELVEPDADAIAPLRAVFEAWAARQPGEIQRRDHRWEYDLGLRESVWGPTWKGFVALHRDASGTVDGYVRYHVDDKWEHRQPRNVVTVDDLHALTDDAYASLWRFLGEIDWASTVQAERRTPAERLPWLLTNARSAELSDVGDGLWVRLFDIPGALAARTYEREGAVVLEAVGGDGPDARQTWLLEAGPAGATCRKTDRSADLTIDVAALGAAYLGGTPLRHAVLPAGVDEHRRGALHEAERLLRTNEEPWSSTFF